MVRKNTGTTKVAPRSKRSKPKGTERVAPPSRSRDREIAIREINNGFIIRESWTTKSGDYKNRETFSPTDPKIDITKPTKGIGK